MTISRTVLPAVLSLTLGLTLAACEAEQDAGAQYKEAAKSMGAAREFLDEVRERDGIIARKSGLLYEILTKVDGDAASPAETDTVRVHYEGRLADETVFDSSYKRGEPAEFPLNRVIAGWTEGMQLMKVGEKYRFYIPPQLGYGARGAGGVIPGNAALVFDVELLAIPSQTGAAG